MTEQLPIPLSRADCYLATAAGMTGVILPANGPQSREEDYLAYMAGDTTIVLPTPGPLKEQWLAIICGDTSVTTPEIKGAFLIGQQMVRVEFLAKAAGVEGVVLPTNPNRTEQYFANIGGVVPDPGVLTQAKGTYIVLNNVLRGIDSLDYIYGDTFQQTYSGKNLFNRDLSQTGWQLIKENYQNGIKLTSTKNTGVCYINYKFPFAPSTSVDAYLNFIKTGTGFVNIYFKDSNDNNVITLPNQQNPLLISSIPNTAVTCDLYFYGDTSSTGAITIFDDIQLEIGATPSAFEPYTGSIYPTIVPSPNPDYPQDIQVVTGEQTVTISDGVNSEDYKVHLTSKNLFDTYGDVSYSYGSTVGTVTNNMDGTITTTANGSSNRGKGQLIKNVIPGQKYTLGVTFYSTTSTLAIKGYIQILAENTTTEVGRLSFNESSSGIPGVRTKLTVTIPNNVTGVWLSFMSNGPSSETTYSDIQFELGETSTSYQSYYNYELCKIGTYQDYIYKSGDDWYVHKDIGKYTFVGNETGTVYAPTATYTEARFYGNIGDLALSSNYTTVSTKFSYLTDNRVAVLSGGGSNNWYIRVPLSYNVTTIEEMRALVANNTTYYALLTPTDTKITDATLISELEAVGSAVLPTPDAFIQVTGNLAGEIEISYYAKSEE